ncbi:sulfated surface glycoprotein 185 [Fopius arisanus]|uniref:Sulfated surface glycoprotein 185 n=1 Tax=Fopius arisanus TaxID=64838 RepID=A0A9R1TCI0_9HYME|nr:PREDICTED: sulfated surface glycoprotein 185-like [Fopius arisanus]
MLKCFLILSAICCCVNTQNRDIVISNNGVYHQLNHPKEAMENSSEPNFITIRSGKNPFLRSIFGFRRGIAQFHQASNDRSRRYCCGVAKAGVRGLRPVPSVLPPAVPRPPPGYPILPPRTPPITSRLRPSPPAYPILSPPIPPVTSRLRPSPGVYPILSPGPPPGNSRLYPSPSRIRPVSYRG